MILSVVCDSDNSQNSDDVIITQNLYPKSVNKSVLNENLKKKTQNFSTRLEELMKEHSVHKSNNRKQVRFKTNPLLQTGGKPSTSIVLKSNTPMYEITLRDTILNDKKLDEKPIGRHELETLLQQTEKTMKGTLASRSNISNLKKGTSFSPALNRQLIDLKSDESLLLEDCDTLQTAKIPKIKVPVDGRKVCVPFTEAIAQQHMLKILAEKKPIDCSKIIAPRQILSNCWFNAMFSITCK